MNLCILPLANTTRATHLPIHQQPNMDFSTPATADNQADLGCNFAQLSMHPSSSSTSTLLSGSTFLYVMSPLCLHTLLTFLSPHERIASRAVSKQFSSAAIRPSLWSRSVYQHNTADWPPMPRSPFDVEEEKSTISSKSRSLPPKWLRSCIGGVLLCDFELHEIAIPLLKFTEVRSLQIRISRSGSRNGEIHSLREAFTALRRLEELRIERDRSSRRLLAALFSTSDATFIPPIDKYTHQSSQSSKIPAIWSYVTTLRRLELAARWRSEPEEFHAFAAAMSQCRWSQLKYLECVSYVETPDVSCSHSESTRIICEKLFSSECLPQLKHLTIRGRLNHHRRVNITQPTSGINLPQLRQLVHSIVMVKPIVSEPDAPFLLDEYSHGLTHLECERFVNWCSLSQLTQLIHLVMHDDVQNMPTSSLELFEMIGHHALPHLATLSIPCKGEVLPTAVDEVRIFNLMSQMTSLTALHSPHLCYFEEIKQQENRFCWFLHLYQFPSLRRIALILREHSHKYRTVPLPLPRGVTLSRDQHRLYPEGGIKLQPPIIETNFEITPGRPPWLHTSVESIVDRTPFTSPDQPEIAYIDAEEFREYAYQPMGKKEEWNFIPTPLRPSYKPTRTVDGEYLCSITIRLEYETISFEELRLEQEEARDRLHSA